MQATAEWIHGGVLIPDLLRAAPAARQVLDRYGLRGCGGPLGPAETLGFFAQAHEVPLEPLLEEIRTALAKPTSLPLVDEPPAPQLGDAIYRPFFKAGIAVVLTLGAVWGAYLLARIAWFGSFRAAGLHEINAHGHAQIFGWVGLFVMGFAYQAFPRFKHATLAHPRWAYASLGLMLAGLVTRSICEPLVELSAGWAMPALTGSLAEIVAVLLFVWIIVATWRGSGKPLAVYDYYILSALVWFVVQAIYEAVYFQLTVLAPSADSLLQLVATYQAPLRDLQIHGFALLMILGVSQRLFHHFYGLPAPHARRSVAALVFLNLAVVGESLGLILMRTSGHGWAALWYGSVLLLAGSVALLVHDWHLFRSAPESDRSLKFLRAAYVWLFVSLGMLALLPAYQRGLLAVLAPESEAAQIGFSHAFYGAVRHAITVGFVSLMIVGVAAKVVPTLNGVEVRRLPALWLPFLLINLGCALRVGMQTATDFTPAAFTVVGFSGVLEVAGLAFWGVHLWRVMNGKAAAAECTCCGPDAVSPEGPITASQRVGDVLDRHPGLLDTFLAFGFRPLANRFIRATVARTVTIGQACRREGVDVETLLAALNAARLEPIPSEKTPGCGCSEHTHCH
jgi:hypothetical protein